MWAFFTHGVAFRARDYGPAFQRNHPPDQQWTDQQGLSGSAGVTFRGHDNKQNMYTAPLTVPVLVETGAGAEKRLRLSRIWLHFSTSETVSVRSILVSDGRGLLADEFLFSSSRALGVEDLRLTGNFIETPAEFDVRNHPVFFRGLAVSVLVDFGVEHDGIQNTIKFTSVGVGAILT